MRESTGVNALIRKGCLPLGARVQRIENGCGPGVPDVAVKWRGRWGWVECKYIRTWPKRSSTPVKFTSEFTAEQRLWLRRHEEWLFVRVADEFFLFDWETAQGIDGRARSEWSTLATRQWVKNVDWREWLWVVTHQ